MKLKFDVRTSDAVCTCGGGLPDPRELVVEDSLSLRAPSGATVCFLTVGEGREGGGVGEEDAPWVETRVRRGRVGRRVISYCFIDMFATQKTHSSHTNMMLCPSCIPQH